MISCTDMTKLDYIKPEGISSLEWTLGAMWGCPQTKTMAWLQEQINLIFLHRDNPFTAEPGHLKLVRKFSGSTSSDRKKRGRETGRQTDRERELISGCLEAKQSWADIKEVVASLRECVLGQRWPAWGPVIICCVHSANHSTLPPTYTQTLLMCDICLGERGGEAPKVKCMNRKKGKCCETFPRLQMIRTKIDLATLANKYDTILIPLKMLYERFLQLQFWLAGVREVSLWKTFWYTGSDVFLFCFFTIKGSSELEKRGSGSQWHRAIMLLSCHRWCHSDGNCFGKQMTSESYSAQHTDGMHTEPDWYCCW